MQPILQTASDVMVGAWQVTAVMAPYLLFGFAVAGLLHVLLPAAWVARHLGGTGWRPSVKAALFGVPLPLCSCSVIPVSASLRAQGAGTGATAAFLMSTPQTGVDSLAVTYGLLGPVIAVIRPVVAFISGALCGIAVDRWGGDAPALAGAASVGGPAAGPAWRRALRHGFFTLPRDIGREVLIGLLVAGVLGAVVPHDFFADRLHPGLGAMLAMMALGVPMYVCSTASVPIALGLINAGISPGAALVFLITGPATNAAALLAMWKMLGRRAVGIYLLCLAVSALGAGWSLDQWILPAFPTATLACHMESPGPFGQAAAALLVVILLAPMFRWRSSHSRGASTVGPRAACSCGCAKDDGEKSGPPTAAQDRT